MNKFTKWAGISSGSIMATILLHEHSVKRTKTFFIQTRQLINRLTKQIKISKKGLLRLNKAIQKVNPALFMNHINHFNNDIQPSLNKIQHQLNHTKDNSQN